MTISISAGLLDMRIPALVSARISGASPIGKTTALGWLARSQRVMVTMVVTISSSETSNPSLASFSAYIARSFVGLLETKRTTLPRARSTLIIRLAPGMSSSPR